LVSFPQGNARAQDLPYSASSKRYYGQLVDGFKSLEENSGADIGGTLVPAAYRLDYQ
jgi:hypothetical protein